MCIIKEIQNLCIFGSHRNSLIIKHIIKLPNIYIITFLNFSLLLLCAQINVLTFHALHAWVVFKIDSSNHILVFYFKTTLFQICSLYLSSHLSPRSSKFTLKNENIKQKDIFHSFLSHFYLLLLFFFPKDLPKLWHVKNSIPVKHHLVVKIKPKTQKIIIQSPPWVPNTCITQDFQVSEGLWLNQTLPFNISSSNTIFIFNCSPRFSCHLLIVLLQVSAIVTLRARARLTQLVLFNVQVV